MAGSQKSWGLLGGAVSCLVALSLIVVASCAPLCAGAACVWQSTGASSESGCHGMTGHGAASFFLAAQASACQFGDTGFAIVGKTDFAVNPVATASDLLAASNPLQGFVRDSSLVSVSSSPPGIISFRTPSLLLRI